METCSAVHAGVIKCAAMWALRFLCMVQNTYLQGPAARLLLGGLCDMQQFRVVIKCDVTGINQNIFHMPSRENCFSICQLM